MHTNNTAQGCIELLDRYGVEIAGKRAVVLGRSNIVGMPVSMLLMHRDATVTMTHSKTVDTASVVSKLLVFDMCFVFRSSCTNCNVFKVRSLV